MRNGIPLESVMLLILLMAAVLVPAADAGEYELFTFKDQGNWAGDACTIGGMDAGLDGDGHTIVISGKNDMNFPSSMDIDIDLSKDFSVFPKVQFQIGIRSLSSEEASFLQSHSNVRTVFAEDANDPQGRFLSHLAQFVKGKCVYFTIDLDGLDPSIMPSVGTPEPGGISWERLLEIARTVSRNAAEVPVFDVVELAPIPGLRAPDFLAAKLVYKLFSYAHTLISFPYTTGSHFV